MSIPEAELHAPLLLLPISELRDLDTLADVLVIYPIKFFLLNQNPFQLELGKRLLGKSTILRTNTQRGLPVSMGIDYSQCNSELDSSMPSTDTSQEMLKRLSDAQGKNRTNFDYAIL